MAKLRKLLEDVHTESEHQIHQLRYKGQQIQPRKDGKEGVNMF